MDEYEEKLTNLKRKMSLEDDPSFLDHLRLAWYAYIVMNRKKRLVNALKWIHFQKRIKTYLIAFYIVHFIGMPTEEDKRKAAKSKEANR